MFYELYQFTSRPIFIRKNTMENNTIIDILTKDKDFSILLTALKTAGLIEKLSGEGTFTFFAPINEAFEQLEEDECDLQSLFQDKEELTRILMYHMLPNKIATKDMIKNDLQYATTLAGIEVEVEADEASVYINDAEIIQPDTQAKNGIIHVIDAVLIPE